jgi:hypothetical protein
MEREAKLDALCGATNALMDNANWMRQRMDAVERKDANLNIDYRSSGHDLASAGQKAREQKMTLAALKQECKSAGLDDQQTKIVLGGFRP